MVLTLVMTSLLPRLCRVNDKMFYCFYTSMPTSDSLQNNLRRKPSLIIVTDTNMPLKGAFLQKVTV